MNELIKPGTIETLSASKIESHKISLRSLAKSIDDAPRNGTHIIAWENDSSIPSIIHWEDYDELGVAATGENGYWAYSEESLNDLGAVCEPVCFIDVELPDLSRFA